MPSVTSKVSSSKGDDVVVNEGATFVMTDPCEDMKTATLSRGGTMRPAIIRLRSREVDFGAVGSFACPPPLQCAFRCAHPTLSPQTAFQAQHLRSQLRRQKSSELVCLTSRTALTAGPDLGPRVLDVDVDVEDACEIYTTPSLHISLSHRLTMAQPHSDYTELRSQNTSIKPSQRNRRRASQPASLLANVASCNGGFTSNSVASPSQSSSSWSSDSSSEESDTDCEIERNMHRRTAKDKGKEPDLEYLDLSMSLPFTVAMMRNSLLSYLATLEEHAKAIGNRIKTPNAPTASSYFGQGLDNSPLARFYAQLDGLREDLRRLALLFPSSPLPLLSPTETLSSSQALLLAKSQSLAADWDRLYAAFSDRLEHQRPAVTSTLLAADPRRYMAVQEGANVPAVASALFSKVQGGFDSLHHTYAAISLRDCWQQGRNKWSSAVSGVPASMTAAAAAAAPSWDSLVTSVKESSSKAGVAVRHSMLEAEAALYNRACELANEGSRLIQYTDLPHQWRNNEHILSGYRFIPLENWGVLLKSTFQLHNETVNIHSHLAGAIIVMPLFWPSKGFDDHTTWADRLVQTIYLIAAMKCLVSSVVWHIFSGCASAKWFERAACVDYSGVALLVAASVWTTIYNEFYCQPNLALLYSLTTLVVGIVGAVLPWAAWFNQRENKPWRIVVFLTMCFTSLAPFAHAVFEHGLFETLNFLSPILPSLLCYIIGLIFYAFNWPERAWPGRFDIFFHAHQIWHVAIVLAILLHYRAALQFHANRFEFSCSFNPLQASLEGEPTTAHLLRVVGGLHGISGLQRADEKVHGWRIVLGGLAGGLVGRVWETGRAWLQQW